VQYLVERGQTTFFISQLLAFQQGSWLAAGILRSAFKRGVAWATGFLVVQGLSYLRGF